MAAGAAAGDAEGAFGAVRRAGVQPCVRAAFGDGRPRPGSPGRGRVARRSGRRRGTSGEQLGQVTVIGMAGCWGPVPESVGPEEPGFRCGATLLFLGTSKS